MKTTLDDPFEVIVAEPVDDFAELARKPASVSAPVAPLPAALPSTVTARFHGFDLEDQPLLAAVPGLPGEIVPARTTVSLARRHIGSSVVVAFENGDARRPIVLGVLQDPRDDALASRANPADVSAAPARNERQPVIVQSDDERVLLSAEREITLRCGNASITLTRAGKVIIKGAYIVSHSSGHHRIKGAVVDIN